MEHDHDDEYLPNECSEYWFFKRARGNVSEDKTPVLVGTAAEPDWRDHTATIKNRCSDESESSRERTQNHSGLLSGVTKEYASTIVPVLCRLRTVADELEVWAAP